MTQTFVRSLDGLGTWRAALESRVREMARFLRDHELMDEGTGDTLEALRQRLSGEKLVVAFVAEFSRGKSELINAIFFADAGRRIMPASPGRTTMCPVELGWDPEEAPGMALLPVETRLEGSSIAELRGQQRAWYREPLDMEDPQAFAQALTAVMRTRPATVDEARALGFWDDEHPQENPPVDARGMVEVPAWRHALINVPHPLLKRGLVVLDTPGLNAIGAEPELTVGLLPSAHAVVFIVGADTGVTKSDLAIWRDHLNAQPLARYVAVNKIDALIDPLSPVELSLQQIEQQCRHVAATLEIEPERVFPISARQALAGRVGGQAELLAQSRLPALETALSEQLLPQRRAVLEQTTCDAAAQVQRQVARHVNDQRRAVAEQMLELRGLRGKSGGKVQLMLQRLEHDEQEFEQCTRHLQATRAVHTRMLKDLLIGLAGDKLRVHLDEMGRVVRESLLQLGAKRAFVQLCGTLRQQLATAQRQSDEIHHMLGAAFSRLNADFGFSLAVAAAPRLDRFMHDLEQIERNYAQYLGLNQAMRLLQPRFMDQFRRMLMSRLRVVFESASGEIELWNKTASAQVDTQLRDRRRTFKRRRESFERIQGAAGELEAKLGELAAQEERLDGIEKGFARIIDDVLAAARTREIAPTTPERASAFAPMADSPSPAPALSLNTAAVAAALAAPAAAATPDPAPAAPARIPLAEMGYAHTDFASTELASARMDLDLAVRELGAGQHKARA